MRPNIHAYIHEHLHARTYTRTRTGTHTHTHTHVHTHHMHITRTQSTHAHTHTKLIPRACFSHSSPSCCFRLVSSNRLITFKVDNHCLLLLCAHNRKASSGANAGVCGCKWMSRQRTKHVCLYLTYVRHIAYVTAVTATNIAKRMWFKISKEAERKKKEEEKKGKRDTYNTISIF